MKILITGTHFTTALAAIEELKEYKDIDIVYVGRRTTQEGDASPSIESQILPKLGVKFIPITAGRLQRAFTIYTLPSLLKTPIGFIQAAWILLLEAPDAILSLGGYVAVPIVIWAWLFSIPIIIHEQTLVTGLANKISSYFADKIAVSFNVDRFKDRQTILTGNPLRRNILEGAKLFHLEGGLRRHLGIFDLARKDNLPVILISCGNQGSHVVNLAVAECIGKLIKISFVIHVTGDNKFEDFERAVELRRLGKLEERYMVRKWIGREYGAMLSKVDLVVSRAGINTLSELAFLGKPALVIPIPYLFADEQNKNAKYFEKLGLVKILPQKSLSGSSLLKSIKSCLNNLNDLKKSAKNAKAATVPDAAKRLAEETILLAHG